jgi:hypothetical protein
VCPGFALLFRLLEPAVCVLLVVLSQTAAAGLVAVRVLVSAGFVVAVVAVVASAGSVVAVAAAVVAAVPAVLIRKDFVVCSGRTELLLRSD